MAGIERINIAETLNGRGAYRFRDAQVMQPAANELYRKIWEDNHCPLLEGDEIKNCAKKDFLAGYDYSLGIDVIFRFVNGTSATLQEKFLTTTFYTLTIEYMQDWRHDVPGDWFNMKCQYYFVGYYDVSNRAQGFTRWVLVNWPVLLTKVVDWRERQNQRDGALSSFRFIDFDKIPLDCLVT